jgi:hypothetical protein
MGYPPQSPGPWQPPGQQAPQQGYAPPQQGSYPPPQQGYAPPQQGYAPQQAYGGGSDAEFSQLYGQANLGAGLLYDDGDRDAVVTEASYGLSQGGKGQWVVTVRVTTGPNAGARELRSWLTINPTKKDGTPNPDGMGMMFNELHALGVPLPPPVGAPGEQGFWDMGWTREQVAQNMVGRPVTVVISTDHTQEPARNRIKFRPARPGAPTAWPQPGQAQPQAPAMGGYQPGPVAQPPAGYQQQYPHPVGQPPAAQPGPGGAGGGYTYPAQEQVQSGPAAPSGGQGGMGQFAPPQQGPPQPGQMPAMPWQQNGTQQAPPPQLAQAPPAPGQQGQAPPPEPWAGQQ